jgi:hypothetical protein
VVKTGRPRGVEPVALDLASVTDTGGCPVLALFARAGTTNAFSDWFV